MHIGCRMALVGVALVGCQGTSGQGGRSPVDLGGTWEVLVSRGESGDSMRVAGEIALLHGSWIERANLVSLLSYEIYGIYDVDFTPVGFDCRPASGVPLVGGRRVTRDSVELVLNPQTDHGGVALEGKMSEGRIAGAWYERRAGGATGWFILRRARP